MVSFPNAKINIGLQITEKRPDGFHNLETIFYPVPIHDVLECIPIQSSEKEMEFKQTGMHVEGDDRNNLCVKAFQLLKNFFQHLPPTYIHLHKAIPMGAGLGGGSADASFILRMLVDLYSLKVSPDQLMEWSLQLGSDCPFFLLNKPAYATGRGEKLESIDLELDEYKILLVNPGIHISTAMAFSNLRSDRRKTDLMSAIRKPMTEWKHLINNHFETVVFDLHPECEKIKNHLYETGALYASMSGSGSTLYGIYEKSAQPLIQLPESFFCKWV